MVFGASGGEGGIGWFLYKKRFMMEIPGVFAGGCGKTTLLRCIAGLEQVSKGLININGTEIIAPGSDRMMVFQDFNQLFPWLNVRNNIISL